MARRQPEIGGRGGGGGARDSRRSKKGGGARWALASSAEWLAKRRLLRSLLLRGRTLPARAVRDRRPAPLTKRARTSSCSALFEAGARAVGVVGAEPCSGRAAVRSTSALPSESTNAPHVSAPGARAASTAERTM